MKNKFFNLLLICFTSLAFAQLPPAFFPDGVHTEFTQYNSLTQAEIDALTLSSSEYRIYWNVTAQELQFWDGSQWICLSCEGSGGSWDGNATSLPIYSDNSILIDIDNDDNTAGVAQYSITSDNYSSVLLSINENGILGAPSMSNAEIDLSDDNLITKRYFDANNGSGSGGSVNEFIPIYLSDITTDLTVGTSKGGHFRMPYGATLVNAFISLGDAGTVQGIEVDMLKDGVSILSTNITTDATEETSETATTPLVISDNTLPFLSKLTFDFVQVPTGAKNAIIYLEVTPL